MKIINGISYMNLDYINDFGFEYRYIDSSNIMIWKSVNIGSKNPIITSETIKKEYLDLLNNNDKPKLLFSGHLGVSIVLNI